MNAAMTWFSMRARLLAAMFGGLLLAGCVSTPLAINELRLTSAPKGAETVPGILSLVDPGKTTRIVVFGIHGMGRTPPCSSGTVARMLRGDAGRSLASADLWDHEACFEPDARHMPVCLGARYTIDSESFGETKERRVIGEECSRNGAPVSLDALFDANQPEKIGIRELHRFGVLTHRRLEPELRTASGAKVSVEIDYYAYWWHGDGDQLQAPFVAADASDQSSNERVALNRLIKRIVMNEGLVDASLYLGEAGDMMRRATQNALCLVVRDLGEPIDTSRSVRDPCAGLTTRSISVLEDRRIVILTQSLGSRILFDSLDGFFGDTNVAIARAILQQGPLVYMSANQLPLLAISQLDVEGPPQAQKTLELDRRQRRSPFNFFRTLTAPAETPEPAIQTRRLKAVGMEQEPPTSPPSRIIAFYDPNDILGYRAGEHLRDGQRDAIFEVTQRYAPPFFLLALPQSAHDKSFERDKGRQFVMCGAERPDSEAERLVLAPDCRR